MRRAAKRDTSEKPIVAALEAAGWLVYRDLPTDLLCFKGGVWKVLECKTPITKSGGIAKDKRRERQIAFLAATNTPIATSPEQALTAIGAIQRLPEANEWEIKT